MSISQSGTTGEEQGFRNLGKGLGKMQRPLGSAVNRLWAPWMKEERQAADWLEDADWARVQQAPLRARALLYGMVASVMALVLWAALAPIDEVARGQGKVIPSTFTQLIQSFDGGAVEEIFVQEGQVVDAGDLLVSIDPTRFVSTFRENRAQYLALQARAARLQALASGSALLLPPEIQEADPRLAENEHTLYESNLQELQRAEAIAEQQLVQRRNELNEVEARLQQATRSVELASEELRVTRPLLGSGAISEVEILRLERDVNNAQGEREQALAQRARLQSAILESQEKLEQVALEAKNKWRMELSETSARLSSLGESGTGLADRIKYAEIRAPVRGTVQRLFVKTEGGVVQPGREVLELVPLDDQLLIETRMSPRDIAFLRPGQKAMVKFSAYDFTVYGGLAGEVEHISADTITDERGQTYYLVRIRTDESGFDENLSIIPGMTAQVDIITGKKTVLSYLLKPILRAKQNALTER